MAPMNPGPSPQIPLRGTHTGENTRTYITKVISTGAVRRTVAAGRHHREQKWRPAGHLSDCFLKTSRRFLIGTEKSKRVFARVYGKHGPVKY
jgi:hypothetical protein